MDETLTELSKLFRTVTKLVKEKTEDYFGNLTPLERVLREVADEDTCSIPNSLLREIAKASNDIQNYHPIMQNIWTGVSCDPSRWRRIYKSLSLLEYVILLGPQRVYDDCKDASMRIRTLTSFRYYDGDREEGGGVRQKALSIVNFVDHPDTIDSARQQALADCEKYVAIENKPAFDFCAGGAFRAPRPSPMSPAWAELGGAFRNQTPLPANPYSTMQSFQTAEEAAKVWGIDLPPPPSLKMQPRVTSSSYDAPAERRPSENDVFASGPDWWSGEAATVDVPSITISNPPGAPPVMTVNLLDDEQSSSSQEKKASLSLLGDILLENETAASSAVDSAHESKQANHGVPQGGKQASPQLVDWLAD